MKKWRRAALGLLSAAFALAVLDRAGARAVLARLRSKPVADPELLRRVQRKLARFAREPAFIRVRVERGCVDLRGPVATRERARVVRAVARVRGVDSVIDLMTESTPYAATSR